MVNGLFCDDYYLDKSENKSLGFFVQNRLFSCPVFRPPSDGRGGSSTATDWEFEVLCTP